MEWIIICASIILIIVAFFLGRKFASKPIEDKNNEIRQECKQLEEQRQHLDNAIQELQQMTEAQKNERKKDLDKLDNDISWKWKELNSIEEQYKFKLNTIQDAKKLAEEAAAERSKVLEQQFQNEKIELEKQKQELNNNIADLQQKLNSLKATKAAAIEAARKEKNIQENKDDYCLILPREEERDIPVLRETQYKISKPRAIAMVIWTNYYQVLAKKKFPQILGKQDVCGIYKLTNQKTGECYIGQALDVRKRWYQHCQKGLGVDTPQGNKLYTAMLEYGLDDFSFELLEECNGNELDKKEKYYIELYQSNIYGYNGNAGNNG